MGWLDDVYEAIKEDTKKLKGKGDDLIEKSETIVDDVVQGGENVLELPSDAVDLILSTGEKGGEYLDSFLSAPGALEETVDKALIQPLGGSKASKAKGATRPGEEPLMYEEEEEEGIEKEDSEKKSKKQLMRPAGNTLAFNLPKSGLKI